VLIHLELPLSYLRTSLSAGDVILVSEAPAIVEAASAQVKPPEPSLCKNWLAVPSSDGNVKE